MAGRSAKGQPLHKTPEQLEEYARKRHFADTPEPVGERVDPADERLRFVIQEHHATRLHWDLRLEHDGVLVSFAVPNALPEAPGDNRLAVHTEDHPLEYLDFHGEIPKGNYGAGSMTIWDRGTFDVLKWEDRKIEVHLHGERVDARYALFPLDKGDQAKDWMVHRMDPPADPDAAAMPEWVPPMLAKAGALPPDEDEAWAYEIKWDGIRAICHSTPGTLKLFTRNHNDVTARYPELRPFNRALSHHRAIVDAEVIAFGPDGAPSFNALQHRMHLDSESQVRRLARSNPVTLVVFDLLWLDGHDVTSQSYLERRELLKALLPQDGPRWSIPDHVVGRGSEVLAAAAAQQLEGVMAKRLDSPYEPGRRTTGWRKVKLVGRQELVVCGWVPGEGRRRERIGALVLGVHEPEGGGLRYAGKVGTGFTEAELDRLAGLLAPLEVFEPPFTAAGATLPKGALWARPELVAEVEFTQWTPDGQLRHPSYKGLRDDKEPAEVEEEAVAAERGGFAVDDVIVLRKPKAITVALDGHEVRVSNPDKVLYPATGFTKRDLLAYHLGIAEVLLPHLSGRPLTLKRYPNGAQAAFFYEKNAPSHRPDWVHTALIPTGKGSQICFVVVEDRATLAWLSSLADLELHTPMALARDITRPTQMVFDLDPGAPATIVECCEVALWLEAMLSGLGLTACAKTSGSKGLQVYVPLNHLEASYRQTKGFSKAVAELLEREAGDRVVSKQTKQLRPGKVLVDWSQNDEHKTTVNVYSLRGRERPTVSTPVSWDEVRRCAQSGEELAFTADEVLLRVAEHGDLFAPVLSEVQGLPAL